MLEILNIKTKLSKIIDIKEYSYKEITSIMSFYNELKDYKTILWK